MADAPTVDARIRGGADAGMASDADIPLDDAAVEPSDMGVPDDRTDAEIDPMIDARQPEPQADSGIVDQADASDALEGPTAAVRGEGASGSSLSTAPLHGLPILLCVLAVGLRRRGTKAR